LDHRVVTLKDLFAKAAKAQQQMPHQLQQHLAGWKNLAVGQMIKASIDVVLQLEPGKELLDQREPGERGQPLALETQTWLGEGIT
jgi:hypothetical protein